jgi:hypothetical protein
MLYNSSFKLSLKFYMLQKISSILILLNLSILYKLIMMIIIKGLGIKIIKKNNNI